MGLARLIRGQVLSLREREFVHGRAGHRRTDAANPVQGTAAQHGRSDRRVDLAELPAFVAAEAGLSFLGIGLTGIPSLGQTINKAQASFSLYPLYLWAPVVTVMVLVVSLNLLGDSVRDAFDPKTRR